MRKKPSYSDRVPGETGVTNLMEYISVSAILIILLVAVMFTVNAVFMQGPADTLRYHAFTDIGNGISVRIVDIYVTAPGKGDITSRFDIPDEVGGADYFVDVAGFQADQRILVQRGDIKSNISIAGIGASKSVTGNTTSRGWNVIQYNWSGSFSES